MVSGPLTPAVRAQLSHALSALPELDPGADRPGPEAATAGAAEAAGPGPDIAVAVATDTTGTRIYQAGAARADRGGPAGHHRPPLGDQRRPAARCRLTAPR